MWLNNHIWGMHYYENIVLKVVLLKKEFCNRASNWLAAGSHCDQTNSRHVRKHFEAQPEVIETMLGNQC